MFDLRWTMQVFVKRFNDLSLEELYKILQLRSEVFVVEQKILCVDPDDADQKAIHIWIEADNKIQAYARVLNRNVAYEDVSIGRVVSRVRNNGYGFQVMKASIDAAKEFFGADKIHISSQLHAKGFYQKCGFTQISAEYMEEGIPHVGMELNL